MKFFANAARRVGSAWETWRKDPLGVQRALDFGAASMEGFQGQWQAARWSCALSGDWKRLERSLGRLEPENRSQALSGSARALEELYKKEGSTDMIELVPALMIAGALEDLKSLSEEDKGLGLGAFLALKGQQEMLLRLGALVPVPVFEGKPSRGAVPGEK